jgi:hypothetical protein
MRPLTALARGYRGLAILWLGTCLLFLAANLIAMLVLSITRGSARHAAPAASVDPKPLRQFFPAMSDADIAALRRESARIIQYEPFTQFREKPSAGRYVNVHESGFRLSKNQGPWPPNPANSNVFVFGGSTTFGYGVADDDTIASYLQSELATLGLRRPPRVYNFGRGAYYSTQERILFEQLLVRGVVPDVAVFIDGLNDFFFKDDMPVLTPWLTRIVEQRGQETPALAGAVLGALPLSRLLGLPQPDQTTHGYPAAPPPASVPYDDVGTLTTVIDRYLANKRVVEAAAREFGVTALFVWQPVPTYRYDLSRQPNAVPFGPHEYSRYGYPKMAARQEDGSLGLDFLWCADVHDGFAEPAYVDQVHYSPAMSARIAACVVKLIRERGLLDSMR